MINTIIENAESLFSGLEGIESNILKFNSKLKKLGIKKIKFRGDLNSELVEKELTLYINPVYNDLSYTSRRSGGESFEDFYSYLMSLGGSESFEEYHQLKQDVVETQETLRVDFGGKKCSIGEYIRERNIIIICVPLPTYNFKLGKSYTYLDFYIKCIEGVFKNHKIKEENTGGLLKKLLLRRYMAYAQKNLEEKNSLLRTSKQNLDEYTQEIAELHNTIKTLYLDIESIKIISKNLERSLIEQLEEVEKLKFVKEVELGDEGIRILFDKIFIKVRGQDIEMGEYEVLLKPKKIEIKNRQPLDYGGVIYHSCHIEGDAICFGDGNTMAYELLGKMELKKLTHFLYIYLKTYNPEDTFLSMDLWIKGKENGGVIPYEEDEEDEEDE